jgi:hypothetical protein
MLEPLGERVAALTAEQRKYFISRVLANWEALFDGEPRGTISTRAMRKQCPSASWHHFVMRPIWFTPTPKSGYGFPQPGKAPSGLGRGRFSYTGDPQGRSTGYGSMPT